LIVRIRFQGQRARFEVPDAARAKALEKLARTLPPTWIKRRSSPKPRALHLKCFERSKPSCVPRSTPPRSLDLRLTPSTSSGPLIANAGSNCTLTPLARVIG